MRSASRDFLGSSPKRMDIVSGELHWQLKLLLIVGAIFLGSPAVYIYVAMGMPYGLDYGIGMATAW